ncbi:hypothetical protein L1887_62260 [Cichorium endivia]|nr:hypothetical protein L1887_62260 [Cichorium endivia]
MQNPSCLDACSLIILAKLFPPGKRRKEVNLASELVYKLLTSLFCRCCLLPASGIDGQDEKNAFLQVVERGMKRMKKALQELNAIGIFFQVLLAIRKTAKLKTGTATSLVIGSDEEQQQEEGGRPEGRKWQRHQKFTKDNECNA